MVPGAGLEPAWPFGRGIFVPATAFAAASAEAFVVWTFSSPYRRLCRLRREPLSLYTFPCDETPQVQLPGAAQCRRSLSIHATDADCSRSGPLRRKLRSAPSSNPPFPIGYFAFHRSGIEQEPEVPTSTPTHRVPCKRSTDPVAQAPKTPATGERSRASLPIVRKDRMERTPHSTGTRPHQWRQPGQLAPELAAALSKLPCADPDIPRQGQEPGLARDCQYDSTRVAAGFPEFDSIHAGVSHPRAQLRFKSLVSTSFTTRARPEHYRGVPGGTT